MKISSLFAGTVHRKDGIIHNARILIRDGRILDVRHGQELSPDSFDASGLSAVPGFIDLHIQGCGGADFLDATPGAVQKIRQTAMAGGCTSLLATTTFENGPGGWEHLGKIRDSLADGARGPGARIFGVHLEGPWLNIERKGGFGKKYFRDPSLEEFHKALDILGGTLRMITIAPELPGALDVIKDAASRGIIVSLGHTTCDYALALKAFDLGADHITHVFNAMNGLHHRNPGMLGAALDDERIYVQAIPDGIHIHPAVLRILCRLKGAQRICIISDATAPCGLPEGTTLDGVGGRIQIRDGGVRLPDGTLAGSALLMDRAVNGMIRHGAQMPHDAFLMAAHTPASAMKMNDRIGALKPGAFADITLLDKTGNVRGVIIDGELQFDKRELN